MESFSHYTKFSYDEKKGFVVEVPVAGDRHGQVPRASLPTLREHVEPHTLTRGGNYSTRQWQRPLEECYSWWLGQLIHYGLPLKLSAYEAKDIIKTALLREELKVPTILKQMEQRMRTASNRQAKNRSRRLATKKSSSKEPQYKLESESDTDEGEQDGDPIQSSASRARCRVRVKIENKTPSDGESDATSSDEIDESYDSETESTAASPRPTLKTMGSTLRATKHVPARSGHLELASKPAIAEEASSSSKSISDDGDIEAGSSSDDFDFQQAVLANSKTVEGASAMYGDTDTSSSAQDSSSEDVIEVGPIRQASKQVKFRPVHKLPKLAEVRPIRQAPKRLEIKRDRNIKPEELEDSSEQERVPTPTPRSNTKRKRRSSVPSETAGTQKQTSFPGTPKEPFTLSDSDEPISAKKEPTPKRRKISSHDKRFSLISDDIHGSRINLISPEPEGLPKPSQLESQTKKQNGKRRSNKWSPASEPTNPLLRAISVKAPVSASKSHPPKPAKLVAKEVTFSSSPPVLMKGILKSSPGFRPRNSILSQALEAAAPPSIQLRQEAPELPQQPPMPLPRKSQENLAAVHGVRSSGYIAKSGFRALNDQPWIRGAQSEEGAQPEVHRTLFPALTNDRVGGLSRRDGGGQLQLQREAVKGAKNGNSSNTLSKKQRRSKGF